MKSSHALSDEAGAAASKLLRRRSRNVVYSSPLPLISLPPDDQWEEFDTPTRTGFQYSLPHMELSSEEYEDTSSSSFGSLSSSGGGGWKRDATATPTPDHERPKICRLLSEYMTHNEVFQTQRHGFGIDTRLVYKRNKETDTVTLAPGAPVENNEDLSFSALFESGNLDRAYRVNGRHYASSNELMDAVSHGTSSANSQPPFAFFVKADMEYDLYCDTDINTHGHIQWYFFRTTLLANGAAWRQHQQQGTTARLRVRFNIRNMLKKSSLYNDGMLPAVYVDGPAASRRGWHHAGTNVCYFKNADTYHSRKTGKVQNYYTLSFVYEFQLHSGALESGNATDSSSNLVVYFAHCYPYTYTKLQRFLLSLQRDPDRNPHLKRRILCKTIAGNNCDLLTITDFSQEDSQDQPYSTKRTGIFLTARVHPGESNSSFVMHGILDFLTGNSLEARYLRHNFVFKVVPMLNPDGVVHGNYRCSLAGTDLNRQWMYPSADLHPTILATKNAILSMKMTRPISLYCDIHGHSRKRNMFLYGCRPFEPSCRTETARLRLLPHLLGKTSNSQRGGFYSFSDCTFSVSGSKKGTGRVVVWKEAEVLHSFTLETSFYGVGTNKKQPNDSIGNGTASLGSFRHFTPFDLRMAGTKFCHAMLPFSQVINLDRAAASAELVAEAAEALHQEPSSASSHALSASSETESPSISGSVSTPSLPPLAPAFSPRSANKLRLAPLQQVLSPATSRGGDNADELILKASTHSPPKQTACLSIPQFLPQTPDRPSASAFAILTATAPPASSASSFPSEFDQLFADDSMTGLLSLSDPEDLLKEIEVTLPDDVLTECADDEDASVGSESDPSGDNMEEEELHSANSWRNILTASTEQKVAEPAEKLPRTRPLRLMRHQSEPRLFRSANLKTATEPAATPARIEQKTESPPSTQTSVKTTAPLAPLRMPSKLGLSKHPLSLNLPRDRNRDIASIHLRAVQRRSKSRRDIQQTIYEAQ
ncbi:Reticulocyte-binding protein 2 a [Globisporangium polare]